MVPALGVTLASLTVRAKSTRTALRSEKTLREQAEQIASDRAALRMGPGGLENVVSQAGVEKKTKNGCDRKKQKVIFAAFLKC